MHIPFFHRKSWWKVLFLTWMGWSVLCLPGILSGQKFQPSLLTAGLEPVEDLSGYWYTEDKEELITVPFTDERSRLNLVKALQTKDGPRLPDSLYLYFEGIAWQAEIYVNGSLIAITRDPFGEHLYLLPTGLFTSGENLLTVRLRKSGPNITLYPEKFLGIYRSCYLLAPGKRQTLPPRQQRIDKAEKVLVYAPWSPKLGYLEDTAGFSRLTDEVLQEGYAALYYAFEPSVSYQHIAARKGIQRIQSLEGCDSVAFLNTYPIWVQHPSAHPWFWLEGEGSGPHFGEFQSFRKAKTGFYQPPERIFLLIFLIIPLLGLVLLKFVGPKTWSFLLDFLIKVKFFFDLIRNGKFLKNMSSILINFYGLILGAVCISIFLYFLQCTGRIETLNILSPESLLYRIMLIRDFALPELFFGTLIFLMLLAGIKLMLGALFSLLYGINGLLPAVQNLEIISTFPVNILLLLPTGALFFIQPELAWISAITWQIIFLIIVLRKIITQFAGLTYIFQFPVSLKILYICALEIMPWVLLV